MKISKILQNGKKVIFSFRESNLNKEFFISDVQTIEKGKRKAINLWNPYKKINTENKVKLIKEVFGFETDEQFQALLVDLKKDYIDLTIIELESFGVSL